MFIKNFILGLLFFVIILGWTQGCFDDSQSELKIVGGKEIAPSKYPSVLKFYDSDNVLGDNLTCTGTCIASNAILTAKHCFEMSEAAISAINVSRTSRVREVNTGWDGNLENLPPQKNLDQWTRVSVKKLALYPGTDPDLDSAVIVIDDSSGICQNTTPICDTRPKIGENIIIAGYGIYEEGSKVKSGVFHEGFNRVFRFSDNLLEYTTNENLQGGTNRGDSGGPVFSQSTGCLRATTIGKESWNRCDNGDCYRNTNIHTIKNWIESQYTASTGSGNVNVPNGACSSNQTKAPNGSCVLTTDHNWCAAGNDDGTGRCEQWGYPGYGGDNVSTGACLSNQTKAPNGSCVSTTDHNWCTAGNDDWTGRCKLWGYPGY